MKRIEAISTEEMMADAVRAAEGALRKWLPRCAVVVNVAWREQPPIPTSFGPQTVDYAMGSRVPRRYRKMMRESLLASAEEAR